MFQEKLDHYQKLNNERLEKIRIEKETKDKMISKIIAFSLALILFNLSIKLAN